VTARICISRRIAGEIGEIGEFNSYWKELKAEWTNDNRTHTIKKLQEYLEKYYIGPKAQYQSDHWAFYQLKEEGFQFDRTNNGSRETAEVLTLQIFV
jgi:hypothetical protein